MKTLIIIVLAVGCTFLLQQPAFSASPNDVVLKLNRQEAYLTYVNSAINKDGVVTGTMAVRPKNSPEFLFIQRFYCGDQKAALLSINGIDMRQGSFKVDPKDELFKAGVFFCKAHSKSF